jgi:hypothetical protein
VCQDVRLTSTPSWPISTRARRPISSRRPGVVHAQEENDRRAARRLALDLGKRLEALTSEPLGEKWQERRDLGIAGELVVSW